MSRIHRHHHSGNSVSFQTVTVMLWHRQSALSIYSQFGNTPKHQFFGFKKAFDPTYRHKKALRATIRPRLRMVNGKEVLRSGFFLKRQGVRYHYKDHRNQYVMKPLKIPHEKHTRTQSILRHCSQSVSESLQSLAKTVAH